MRGRPLVTIGQKSPDQILIDAFEFAPAGDRAGEVNIHFLGRRVRMDELDRARSPSPAFIRRLSNSLPEPIPTCTTITMGRVSSLKKKSEKTKVSAAAGI